MSASAFAAGGSTFQLEQNTATNPNLYHGSDKSTYSQRQRVPLERANEELEMELVYTERNAKTVEAYSCDVYCHFVNPNGGNTPTPTQSSGTTALPANCDCSKVSAIPTPTPTQSQASASSTTTCNSDDICQIQVLGACGGSNSVTCDQLIESETEGYCFPDGATNYNAGKNPDGSAIQTGQKKVSDMVNCLNEYAALRYQKLQDIRNSIRMNTEHIADLLSAPVQSGSKAPVGTPKAFAGPLNKNNLYARVPTFMDLTSAYVNSTDANTLTELVIHHPTDFQKQVTTFANDALSGPKETDYPKTKQILLNPNDPSSKTFAVNTTGGTDTPHFADAQANWNAIQASWGKQKPSATDLAKRIQAQVQNIMTQMKQSGSGAPAFLNTLIPKPGAGVTAGVNSSTAGQTCATIPGPEGDYCYARFFIGSYLNGQGAQFLTNQTGGNSRSPANTANENFTLNQGPSSTNDPDALYMDPTYMDDCLKDNTCAKPDNP